MSKGSKQRPVDKKKFDDNFDRIFRGAKCHTQQKDPVHIQAVENMQKKKADVKTTSQNLGQATKENQGMSADMEQHGIS